MSVGSYDIRIVNEMVERESAFVERLFTEVHKVVVARDTLKGVEPVEGWPSDHVPSLRPAGEQTFARLVAEARSAA